MDSKTNAAVNDLRFNFTGTIDFHDASASQSTRSAVNKTGVFSPEFAPLFNIKSSTVEKYEKKTNLLVDRKEDFIIKLKDGQQK